MNENQKEKIKINHNNTKQTSLMQKYKNLDVQLCQSKQKIVNLERLICDLTQIIQSTQLLNYQQLILKLNNSQKKSSQLISQYELKIKILQNTIQFKKKHYQISLNQIQAQMEALRNERDQYKNKLSQNIKNTNNCYEQLLKSKKLIKNQQQLIDSFKNSIDQQVLLQKELIKSAYQQKQAKLTYKYQHKIKQIKNKYHIQLNKINCKQIETNYSKEIKLLGNYLTDKKKDRTNQYEGNNNYQTNPYDSKQIQINRNHQDVDTMRNQINHYGNQINFSTNSTIKQKATKSSQKKLKSPNEKNKQNIEPQSDSKKIDTIFQSTKPFGCFNSYKKTIQLKQINHENLNNCFSKQKAKDINSGVKKHIVNEFCDA